MSKLVYFILLNVGENEFLCDACRAMLTAHCKGTAPWHSPYSVKHPTAPLKHWEIQSSQLGSKAKSGCLPRKITDGLQQKSCILKAGYIFWRFPEENHPHSQPAECCRYWPTLVQISNLVKQQTPLLIKSQEILHTQKSSHRVTEWCGLKWPPKTTRFQPP